MPLLTRMRIVSDPEDISEKFQQVIAKALPHGGSDPWTFDWSVHNINVHRPEHGGTFMECLREILEFYINELQQCGPTQDYEDSNIADLERSVQYWENSTWTQTQYYMSLEERVARTPPHRTRSETRRELS